MSRIPAAVRKKVIARADGYCEVCGLPNPDHIHHRKLRSQGGRHTPANLLHIHHGCHEQIHANPRWSYELGHLVPSWLNPEDVPVQALIPEDL